MKQLTKSQATSIETRLKDIIGYTESIATLTRRMQGDKCYVNDQFLQMLADDAHSITYLVNELKSFHAFIKMGEST